MAEEKDKAGAGKAIQKATPAYVSPFDEMERMFERFLPRGWLSRQWGWPELTPFEARVPRVDVVDRDNDILLRAEIPGVNKEDLDISVSDDSVTIKGSTGYEEREEKANYFSREITQGSFSRTIALPAFVDTEKAKAAFNNGILELTLPKVERAKRRRIPVE